MTFLDIYGVISQPAKALQTYTCNICNYTFDYIPRKTMCLHLFLSVKYSSSKIPTIHLFSHVNPFKKLYVPLSNVIKIT